MLVRKGKAIDVADAFDKYLSDDKLDLAPWSLDIVRPCCLCTRSALTASECRSMRSKRWQSMELFLVRARALLFVPADDSRFARPVLAHPVTLGISDKSLEVELWALLKKEKVSDCALTRRLSIG